MLQAVLVVWTVPIHALPDGEMLTALYGHKGMAAEEAMELEFFVKAPGPGRKHLPAGLTKALSFGAVIAVNVVDGALQQGQRRPEGRPQSFRRLAGGKLRPLWLRLYSIRRCFQPFFSTGIMTGSLSVLKIKGDTQLYRGYTLHYGSRKEGIFMHLYNLK